MQTKVWSVKDINYYIKNLLSGDSLLSSLWIKGEISNYKLHSSGHMYFTLKDDSSNIKCVMFRSRAQMLNFTPKHGMEVLIHGYISVFERDGQYQLYVEDMLNAGAGMLNQAYERLKEQLLKEGLFDQERKRRLPFLPKKIGIVTSPTGAAVRDMMSIIGRRSPQTSIILVPALVQGQEGTISICRSLEQLYQQDVDAIIVGRGGGSLEELWCFNTEEVVRKIAASPVPIISAVGHETDFTLADFAADVRAATPSMAAELVVPVTSELIEDLEMKRLRLITGFNKMLSYQKQRLYYIEQNPIWYNPERMLNNLKQDLDVRQQKLIEAITGRVNEEGHNLKGISGKLDALSPLKVLSRGFAICLTEHGEVIRRMSDVTVNDKIEVKLLAGSLDCIVTGQKEENND